jgi:hypothetical protein
MALPAGNSDGVIVGNDAQPPMRTASQALMSVSSIRMPRRSPAGNGDKDCWQAGGAPQKAGLPVPPSPRPKRVSRLIGSFRDKIPESFLINVMGKL